MLCKDDVKFSMIAVFGGLLLIILYAAILLLTLPLKTEIFLKFLSIGLALFLIKKISKRDVLIVNLLLTTYILVTFEYGFLHKNWGELAIVISYFAMSRVGQFSVAGLVAITGYLLRSRSTQAIGFIFLFPVNPIRLFWTTIIGYHATLATLGFFFLDGIHLVGASASNLGRSTLIANVIGGVPDYPFGYFTYEEYQASVENNVLKVFNEDKYTDPHSFIASSIAWLGPVVTIILLRLLHTTFVRYQVASEKQKFMVVSIAVYLCTATMSLANTIFLLWCFTGYFYEYRKCRSYSRQL